MGPWVAWFGALANSDPLPCAALKLPCPHFSRVLAKTQYVVRSAKRTLDSPNATLASLKHTCGPRLLEKRKRQSVGGGPQKSCNGLTNTAHDVIYCLLHRSGQPDTDAPSEPVHPAPDPTAGHSMRMDSLSTLAADSQGRGRMPPPPKAPSFLLEVIADLESRESTVFDHSLQYKKQFRALKARKNVPREGTLMIHVASHITVSQFEHVYVPFACRTGFAGCTCSRGWHGFVVTSDPRVLHFPFNM